MLPHWFLNFGSLYLKDERCVECPRSWEFFGTYHLRKKYHTKPPFHIGKLMYMYSLYQLIMFVCKCPIRLVFYTSNWFVEFHPDQWDFVRQEYWNQIYCENLHLGVRHHPFENEDHVPILHCADAVARPTNAFAHIAADQIESWSNPAGTFCRFDGGKTRNLMNRQDQLPTRHWYNYEALSLCLSLMSTSSEGTTKEVRTHDVNIILFQHAPCILF